MALTSKFNKKAIEEGGQRLNYGEYPVGKAKILDAKSSNRSGSTWARLTIEDSTNVVYELRGDMRDFQNPLDPLDEQGNFNTAGFMYACAVEGDRPFFLPVE